MSRPRFPLTPALQQQVVAFTRAGGFPAIAAEAAGVPLDAFADWMRRGESPRASAFYGDFARAVRQAHAQSRLSAEAGVRDDRPHDWLRYGPGRDTPRAPGWGAAVKPHVAPAEAAPMLEHPDVQALMRTLSRCLGPWPEAKAAIVARLKEK